MPLLHTFRRVATRGLALTALLPLGVIGAQSRTGARPVMPQAAEMALARSAAPSAISATARVWVWNGSRYQVADSGASGVNCFLSRAWVPSVEPHCLDAEASATILPILMHKIEQYAQGVADSMVERQVTAGLRSPPIQAAAASGGDLHDVGGAGTGGWQRHGSRRVAAAPDDLLSRLDRGAGGVARVCRRRGVHRESWHAPGRVRRPAQDLCAQAMRH